MLRQRGRVGLMAAALVGLVVSGAHAQPTTERSASILEFPKVISDGTRDTIIQITNTSNSMVHAHCFYVNGALTFPDLPPGPINPPLWTEVDFDIWLTKQQPTHWVVSQGRLVDATDPVCTNKMTPPFYGCNGAGLDPGRVPPVVEYFTGELKCIEVDATGHPVSGNHLKGEATLVTNDVCEPNRCVLGTCTLSGDPCATSAQCTDPTGLCVISGTTCASTDDCRVEGEVLYDVAKYNAIGILGNENNDGDGVLCLGGESTPECPLGAEYDACPQTWIANHFAEGAFDPVDEQFDTADSTDSSVNTAFTIVPCTQNFETQQPETVTIDVLTFNEYEQAISNTVRVTCWDDLFLDEIHPTNFSFATLGTTFAQTRLRPSNLTQSGFLMVGEEFHSVDTDSDTFTSSAAVNYHIEGSRPGPDLITIPAEQLSPGAGQ